MQQANESLGGGALRLVRGGGGIRAAESLCCGLVRGRGGLSMFMESLISL